MRLLNRPNYLSLTSNQKLLLISELHLIRQQLKDKPKKVRKTKKKQPRRIKRPTLLSPKMEKLFDQLDDKSKRLILYGKP